MVSTRRKPSEIQFSLDNQPTKEVVISEIGDLDLNSLSDTLEAMCCGTAAEIYRFNLSLNAGTKEFRTWLARYLPRVGGEGYLGLPPGAFDPESPTAFYIYWWVYEWRKTFKANQGKGKGKGKGKERAQERERGGRAGRGRGVEVADRGFWR